MNRSHSVVNILFFVHFILINLDNHLKLCVADLGPPMRINAYGKRRVAIRRFVPACIVICPCKITRPSSLLFTSSFPLLPPNPTSLLFRLLFRPLCFRNRFLVFFASPRGATSVLSNSVFSPLFLAPCFSFGISRLWHLSALASLSFGITQLWHLSALPSVSLDIPQLWHLSALDVVRSNKRRGPGAG